MKRLLFLCLPAMLFLVLFTQCRKDVPDGSVYNSNFYTDVDPANDVMFLYIDGQYKGKLPYFAKAPACGTVDGDGHKPLNMQLKSGTYKIEGKDDKGNIKSSGTIFISKNKSSGSGGVGGQSMSIVNDCLTVGLSE